MTFRNPSATSVTLEAGVAQTILADAKVITGVRLVNWTASPVYVQLGTSTGTPAAAGPSDVVPALANGLPGQYECPFGPVGGIRVVGASAGTLSVFAW